MLRYQLQPGSGADCLSTAVSQVLVRSAYGDIMSAGMSQDRTTDGDAVGRSASKL